MFMLIGIQLLGEYDPYHISHIVMLHIISNTASSVELALKKRCVKFTWSCLNSCNDVVETISNTDNIYSK